MIEVDSFKYITEKINKINNDLAHHKIIAGKYKRAHCVISNTQICLNSISLAFGSSMAISLATGIGAPVATGFSIVCAISSGLGLFSNVLDKRILKKVHKHYQLMVLARTLDLKLFSKHLYDNKISPEEFKLITDKISEYYRERDLIITKNLFVGSNIQELAKEFTRRNSIK